MRAGCAFALLIALGVSWLGCGPEDERDVGAPSGARPLLVYTVNYPLAFFAERVGGADVEVVFPAPADVDPAFWSPRPEEVAAFQGADLVLLGGAGYARWVERASLSQRRLVDTSAALRERLLPQEGGVVHSHGPLGEHSHRGTAFTLWLDPQLAAAQAAAIAEAFARARPERADAFRSALAELEAELAALDAALARAAALLGDEPLLFSHPVYAYFARRYRLNERSLDWEPDALPDAAAWQALDTLRESHPARVLLWEAEPLEETRARLEARGIRSVVYAPAANRPAHGDWLEVMRGNAERFGALAASLPPPAG